MDYQKLNQLMGCFTASEITGAIKGLEILVRSGNKNYIDRGFEFLYNLIEEKTEKEEG